MLHVLYLIFNEGYTATAGPELARVELTREAIRLTRLVHRLAPDDGEVAGLLALMLLTDARRPARVRPDGALVPLAEQDRTLWDGAAIREGIALVETTLASGAVGPYQVQAAIAAIHAEAPSADATDWPQILALYDLLERLAPNPMVTLNRAVAAGMAHGPKAGLAVLDDHRRRPRRPPPPRLGPSPPPRAGRRPHRGPRVLPRGRARHHQPPGAALPRTPEPRTLTPR